MEQEDILQPSNNIKDRIFAIRNDKILELFQKLVDEEKLLLKNKKNSATHMKNHPKYCNFHCLIGHTLEYYSGFKSWLHKSIKASVINLLEEYFEMSSTCYALPIKKRYNDGYNFQNKEEEPWMINNV